MYDQIKTNQLFTFITVAHEGSIHGASRKLYLTQPATSKHIKNLESELGVPLFKRHSTGIELTIEGERFLIRAKRIISELKAMANELKSTGGSVSIGVNIAAGRLRNILRSVSIFTR